MRRSHVTRRSDFSVALRAMLNRSSIVISLGLLLIEAPERRPEALRVTCAIAEEVLHEHRRDVSG
jgi:hypothetical protein